MRTLIISPERVRRTFSRLAYEVVERNRGATDLVLFGILKKGLPVAKELANHITPLADAPIAAYPLDVAAFRDDRLTQSEVRFDRPIDVTGMRVLLVDDVLYTGRTARAALDAIIRYGRPACIQLAVLVDRGTPRGANSAQLYWPLHSDETQGARRCGRGRSIFGLRGRVEYPRILSSCCAAPNMRTHPA